MNKKLNTVLFLVLATVLNLLLLAVVAVVLSLLFSLVYKNIEVSMALSWVAVLVILFGSIAVTMFLYSKIIKWAMRRWKLDNYIEPLFGSRKR